MIITLTMNPAIDKTAELEVFQVGELNRLQNVMMDAGGKGINVSKTIRNLEGNSIAYGLIAGNSGSFIENELDQLNIQHDFIRIEGNTRTNLKVLDKDKVLTELNESGPTPSSVDLEILKNKISDTLNDNDILVISGSVPANVPAHYYYDLIQIAHQKQAKVILDADGPLFKEGLKASPTIIKPNKFELCQYYNVSENIDDEEIVKLARKFISGGVKIVAVSMGSKGALFVSDTEAMKVNALKIKAHSSVGAGDAMVAAIAYSLDNEYNLENLVKLSVATSAGAVVTEGTKPPTKALVDEFIERVEIKKL